MNAGSTPAVAHMISRRQFFGVLAAPFVVGLLAERHGKPKPIAFDPSKFDPSKMRVFVSRVGKEIELHGARVVAIKVENDQLVHAYVSIPGGLCDLVAEAGDRIVISDSGHIEGVTLRGASNV